MIDEMLFSYKQNLEQPRNLKVHKKNKQLVKMYNIHGNKDYNFVENIENKKTVLTNFNRFDTIS